uniref:Uncharacterized protein n=1 Tax=Candidatus Kentrum sp. DK TaxID=2126562 RepID=A0A450SFM7_9GAMM|nr:MAG: hypothetical protein BECKDK2373C_GA0170839_103235 [Candidatus Kentron sp. DK]
MTGSVNFRNCLPRSNCRDAIYRVFGNAISKTDAINRVSTARNVTRQAVTNFHGKVEHSLPRHPGRECRDPVARDGNRFGCGLGRARSLSDLGVRREGKRDRDQNLCKFEANSELFNENLRGFWPISAFPQQNHPKSDRLLGRGVFQTGFDRGRIGFRLNRRIAIQLIFSALVFPIFRGGGIS